MFFAACQLRLQGIEWNVARRLMISQEPIHLELPNGVARDPNGNEIGHVPIEYGASIDSVLNFSEEYNISHEAYVFALADSYQGPTIDLRVEFHTSTSPTGFQIRGLAEAVGERGVGGWAIDMKRHTQYLVHYGIELLLCLCGGAEKKDQFCSFTKSHIY